MAEGWAGLDADSFELDAVLPDQYHEQVSEYTPEQRLMEAVLLDGIKSYRQGRKAAQRWVLAGPSPYLYSFTTICTALGLDADTIRRRLKGTYDV